MATLNMGELWGDTSSNTPKTYYWNGKTYDVIIRNGQAGFYAKDVYGNVGDWQALPKKFQPNGGTSGTTMANGLVFPIAGSYNTGFTDSWGAARTGHTHKGTDIGAKTGTALVAVTSGTITKVFENSTGGKIIYLQGEDGQTYKYMHLSAFNVSVGDKVSQGQKIGAVGSTGTSTGPHLHFEILDTSGANINPYSTLKGMKAISAGEATNSTGATSASVTKYNFATSLLNGLGMPMTGSNVQAVVSWINAEGGHWNNSAKFNPLCTSQNAPGATSMNSHGVKVYTSWEQGLQATIATLTNGRYGDILAALKTGNAASMDFGGIVSKTPWGTKYFKVGSISTDAVAAANSPVTVLAGTNTGAADSYQVATSTAADDAAFFAWMGRNPTAAEKTKIATESWDVNVLRRYAVTNGGSGTEMVKAKNTLRQLAAPFYGGDPSLIPDSLLNTLISSGDYADSTYLTNVYFPHLKGTSATNPLASPFVDMWVSMTGRSLTYTAGQKLSEIVKTYGYTDVGMAAWEQWLKTTDSAYTGNWGADHRAAINADFQSILGRDATPNELSKEGPYWMLADDAGNNARLEAIRGTDEYKAIYAAKPDWMSEEDFIAEARAQDAVTRRYLGDPPTVNEDGSLTFTPGAENQTETPIVPKWKTLTTIQFANDLVKYDVEVVGGKYYKDGEELTSDELDALLPDDMYYKDAKGFHYAQDPGTVQADGKPASVVKPPSWKTLSNAQFESDLAAYGVTVSNGKYIKDGKELSPAELDALLPDDMYYRDAKGFHYVQEEGAVDKYGQAAVVTKPRTTPAATTTKGFGNFGLSFVTPETVASNIKNNIYSGDLADAYQWLEEAAYDEAVYNPILTEAFGEGFSETDWYKFASGGKGSGLLKAKLLEAQNRVAYRENWRNYYGMDSDPTPADYDYLTSTFVSPNEFAHRMAAKESAKSQLDSVNDVLGRVFGETASLEELENLAMGGTGSGELQSKIDQATRLEQYRWLHKQYYNAEPTPDDYAKYAGYASSAQLQWEITVAERKKELGPEINEAFQKAYGYQLDDTQLQTMLGEQEGYGELNRLYKDAQEEVDKEETARRVGMTAEKTGSIYTTASQGGIKQGLPGFADIGV